MNGVDAIAFTAGVGENDIESRKKICEYLGYLGVETELQSFDISLGSFPLTEEKPLALVLKNLGDDKLMIEGEFSVKAQIPCHLNHFFFTGKNICQHDQHSSLLMHTRLL